jgi:hypothetical protein
MTTLDEAIRNKRVGVIGLLLAILIFLALPLEFHYHHDITPADTSHTVFVEREREKENHHHGFFHSHLAEYIFTYLPEDYSGEGEQHDHDVSTDDHNATQAQYQRSKNTLKPFRGALKSRFLDYFPCSTLLFDDTDHRILSFSLSLILSFHLKTFSHWTTSGLSPPFKISQIL